MKEKRDGERETSPSAAAHHVLRGGTSPSAAAWAG